MMDALAKAKDFRLLELNRAWWLSYYILSFFKKAFWWEAIPVFFFWWEAIVKWADVWLTLFICIVVISETYSKDYFKYGFFRNKVGSWLHNWLDYFNFHSIHISCSSSLNALHKSRPPGRDVYNKTRWR